MAVLQPESITCNTELTNEANVRGETTVFPTRVASFSFSVFPAFTGDDSPPRTRSGAVNLKNDSADVCHRRIHSGRN